MTGKELYHKLKTLTVSMANTNFPEEMIIAAKKGNIYSLKKLFHLFKITEKNLFKAIQELDEEEFVTIFPAKSEDADNEKFFVFDLDPLAFYAVILLAEIEDELLIFEAYDTILTPLRQKGYPELAEHFANQSPEYPCYKMLVDIYN